MQELQKLKLALYLQHHSNVKNNGLYNCDDLSQVFSLFIRVHGATQQCKTIETMPITRIIKNIFSTKKLV